MKDADPLSATHPDLAAEADGWDASLVTFGSNKVLSWHCDLGHAWKASPKDRTQHRKRLGCPFCSGHRVWPGYNDLLTMRPDLAAQASGWDPSLISCGSNKKLPWRCDMGHVWEAMVCDRQAGKGCPYCANRRVLKGYNDLLTTHPIIAAQAYGWDPATVMAGINKKLQWRCSEGHIWEAIGNSRIQGRGCPSCAMSGYKPSEPSWLYLLSHSELNLLQIGITNNPEVRLKRHYHRGWEMLDLRGPMDGVLTRDWETSILRTLRDRSVEFASVKFDGYTESWAISSFPVTQLRELMDIVQELEW